MKVILLQDIKGLGRKNDVKEINDGYARNFLIPKKLGAQITQELLQKRSGSEEHEKRQLEKLNILAKNLEKETLVFKMKVGEKNEVFGSVNRDDIKKAFNKKGIDVVEVILVHPLKTTGEHDVEIDLGHGIHSKIKAVLETDKK